MTTDQLREEIAKILGYEWPVYLKDKANLNKIMVAVAEHDRYVIGEDFVKGVTLPDGSGIPMQFTEVVIANQLKAEQRRRAGL